MYKIKLICSSCGTSRIITTGMHSACPICPGSFVVAQRMGMIKHPTTVEEFLQLPVWDGSAPRGAYFCPADCQMGAKDADGIWWKIVGDNQGCYWRRVD